MFLRQQIVKNIYRDSLALMQVAMEVEEMHGVEQATLVLATPANLELARDAGLTDGSIEAGANDLLIAISADSDKALDDAFELAEDRLQGRSISDGRGETDAFAPPVTLEMAVRECPEADLALISCPGDYATAEAMKALRLGLHVMIFSDNVSLADEIVLKTYARDNDLMMMGPDCGTAIINGVPLGVANATRPGPVGVVAASGTGLQQVVCLLDRREIGISQAIGTGGRDLEAKVGGITMIQGLRALSADEATRVIVLVSKPPDPDVARKLIDEARSCGKPVVVNFLGLAGEEAGNLSFTDTLAAAADKAAALLGGTGADAGGRGTDAPFDAAIAEPLSRLGEGQVNLRGLYSGGTFCYEAQLLLQDGIGPVWSHTPLDANFALPDPHESRGHTVIDLGDDLFTQGRPHPMIDQRTRNRRLLEEAADPTTAVILFDVVLGYGAHADPAHEIADVVGEARALADVPGSSMVTAMARNGVTFGMRVSGTGGLWFETPAPLVEGLYFPGYSIADAGADMGDSAITETAGLGGFAMAASPAIVLFIGGTPADALAASREMHKITIGSNSAFTLPALDFANTAAGIDIRKVVDSSIQPIVNTGIAHKEAGIGQIGAGITEAPGECFSQAITVLHQVVADQGS